MFEFLLDAGNYETRKVARSNYQWGFISTALVSDGSQPYETAVQHEKYGDGKMVIVEAYDTEEDASLGHKRWVEKMTANTLPKRLIDCNNSGVASMGASLGCNLDKELKELNA